MSAIHTNADRGPCVATSPRPGQRHGQRGRAGGPTAAQLNRGRGIDVTSRDDPWPVAALDAQQHTLGIDIADLERDNLRDAQSSAVRNAWRHTAGEQSALNGAIRSYCTKARF